ncbi:hypothetical protein P4H66_11140 [Paenibacillus dokdonensis]|uniref:ESX secretion-associated protein EspG n=1 Tax=Paenibacillus dokdonensis TaxID=2567944 RepID=A0ABU6GKY5_9BACL|nr:hypothetical protein [Paenibacillus dokdonensis]MEC0240406.1 hypothetical protein [Paenibacillus dokdonensis]
MLTIHASKQDTITLDNKEFFFLAGILGSDRLLGIEDPFQGYLAEEIAEEWDVVKESLLEKGYLVEEDNGVELAMPPKVFSRVAIAGLAERSCWLRYKQNNETFEGYLHATNERVVQVCKSERDFHYKLDELGTVDEACGRLIDEMDLKDYAPADTPALLLSKKKFGEILSRASALTLDELSDELAAATNDMEGSIALARCMKFRTVEGEMHLSTWNGSSWETQNAAFVVNDSMNWLVRMSMSGDQDWLTASPASKQQFQEMLLLWLKQSAESDGR